MENIDIRLLFRPKELFGKNVTIPKRVWDSWESGMVYYLNKPAINNVVLKEKVQRDSCYGLFEKIEKRIDNLN